MVEIADILAIWEKIRIKGFPLPGCSIMSLETPKKVVKLNSERKIFESNFSVAIWNRLSQKFKFRLSRLRKHLQSSTTSAKWSERSIYGRRMMVLRPFDLSFRSYWGNYAEVKAIKAKYLILDENHLLTPTTWSNWSQKSICVRWNNWISLQPHLMPF